MTVTSTLLTVMLAAIGVATFAEDPFVLAATLVVSLLTLAVLAARMGRSVNPPFSHPTPDMLFGSGATTEATMNESEPAAPEAPEAGASEL